MSTVANTFPTYLSGLPVVRRISKIQREDQLIS